MLPDCHHLPTHNRLQPVQLQEEQCHWISRALLADSGSHKGAEMGEHSSSMISRAMSVLLTLCAVAVTLLLAKREFFPAAAADRAITSRREPRPVEAWEEIRGRGHAEGPSDALVTIVEFADFECPACAMFETRVLAGIRANYGSDVRIVFRHWPLGYHRFAYPAARASECAAEQGRFGEFRHQLYFGQDSLGLKSWLEVAVASGVPDTAAFGTCNRRPGKVTAVEDDLRAAERVGASGTPAVILQGALIEDALDSLRFDERVRAAIAKAKEGE